MILATSFRDLRGLLCLIALIVGFMGSARAADSSDEGGNFYRGLEKISNSVANRINGASGSMSGAMYTTALSISSKLTPVALRVGGTLAFIFLVVGAIKSFGGRGDSMAQVVFDVGLPVVFAGALIHDYSTRMDELKKFLEVIQNLSGTPVSNMFGLFGTVLKSIGQAFLLTFSELAHQCSSSITGCLSAFADALISLLFMIPIMLLIFTGIAEVAGLLLLGPFLFAVGVAFGPLFIATLVTPWTNDYFGKWLGFIVGSAFVTGVAGVVTTIAVTIFDPVLNAAAFNGDMVAVSLGTVAILIITLNSMLAQVPGIASALVPGTLGVKGGSGNQVGQVADKVGGDAKRIGGKGASLTAKGVGAVNQRMQQYGMKGLNPMTGVGKNVKVPSEIGGNLPLPTINMK